MAIVFDKTFAFSAGIENAEWFFTHNNHIIKFHSDSGKTATHADVQGIVIYPSPTGHFEFNLKQLYIDFINNATNGLIDDIDLVLGNNVHYGGGGYPLLTVRIYFDDGTNESANLGYRFGVLGAVRDMHTSHFKPQNYDYLNFGFDDKITVFKGYPIDFTVGAGSWYNEDDDYLGGTGGAFGQPKRICLDKGDVQAVYGSAIKVKNTGGDEKLTIQVKKKDCDGIYLKWLSMSGGVKYWLFPDKKKTTLQAKDNGFYIDEFADDETNNTKYRSLGKSGNKQTTQLHAIGLEKYEREYLADIISSPRVWLYMGNKGDLATSDKFKTVKLVDNSFIVDNAGRNEYRISLTIEELVNDMY